MRDEFMGLSRPLAPSIIPASVYSVPDLDALDRICEGRDPGFIYARDNHPNGQALAEAIAAAEAGKWGLVMSSGMGAVASAILALVQQGDRLVASDRLYGRTAQFLGQELQRFGITVEWVDANSLAAVERALRTKAKALVVETISNPTLRVADVPNLAKITQSFDCALVIDNTFATPALYRPLEHGAVVAIESLTKLIGGHSDLTLGAVAGLDSDLRGQISVVSSVWGMSPSPFDCWLGLRSLPTMELRVLAAVKNARELASWLIGQPGVERVLYPGLPDHPDHELASRMFPMGPGNMIAIDLDGGRPAVNRFMRRSPGIPFSPSLGHFSTTCSHPATTSHRYVEPAERHRQGISDGMIRLSVGIEPLEVICREIKRGLA